MLYPIELLAPRASPSIVAASQGQPGGDKSRTSTLAIPLNLFLMNLPGKSRVRPQTTETFSLGI
jgi:hypothetical protein